MTPKEHAEEFIRRLHNDDDAVDGSMAFDLIELIRIVVAEEREACAKIADDWVVMPPKPIMPGERIAAAIRARK